ncbi:predicted protein [Thalassiosira pseudonana CCMP1335]|uniref:SAP domain-containing protein n=1 Tax=Thalassiosira pseudonana TaxID=35128 RepID=B8BYA7_THAPS|nr:predicted protein [Thalassiosira pseudonana CCMP1335]EED94342.1 predicted protein [Thalassiosira pseudonana CCMP1335]
MPKTTALAIVAAVALLPSSTVDALSFQPPGSRNTTGNRKTTSSNNIWALLPTTKTSSKLSLLPPHTTSSSDGSNNRHQRHRKMSPLLSAWSHLTRNIRRSSSRFLPFNAIMDKSEDQTSSFFMESDDDQKEWSVNTSKDSFQRARLAEQLRLSKETSASKPSPVERGVDASKIFSALQPNDEEEGDSPFSLLASQVSTEIVSPLLNPSIEKNVPPEIITGAAINGGFLTFLTATFLFGLSLPLLETLVAATAVGIFAAYVSITEGKAGEALRTVGKYTMDVTDMALDKFYEIEAGKKIEKASKALDTLNKVGSKEVAKGVLVEAERAVKKVRKADEELEKAQTNALEAEKKRKEALKEAGTIIDQVEQAKLGVIKKKEAEKKQLEKDELEKKRLEDEKIWLAEQNRLVEERRIARMKEEIAVDYDAAARLAFVGKSGDFEEFKAQYFSDTSAMIAKKHQDRIAEEKRAIEEEEARIAAEKAQAELELKQEQERIAAAKADEERRLREEQEAAEKAQAELELKQEQERIAAAKADEERRLREEQEAAEKAQVELELKHEQERIAAAKADEERMLREEQDAAEKAQAELELRREQERIAAAKADAERILREEQETALQEEARLTEFARLAEEARTKEESEARRLEEQAAAAREAVRLAEAQGLMDDDDDDDELDEDDWEASVRLANELVGLEGLGGDFDLDPNDEDLMNEFLQSEMSELTQEEEDALGKAAREAVRKYEEEQMRAAAEKKATRSSWDDDMVVDGQDEKVENVAPPASLSSDVDYSAMTVAELKDLLRDRGLKVGGKKSELIERLMSS